VVRQQKLELVFPSATAMLCPGRDTGRGDDDLLAIFNGQYFANRSVCVTTASQRSTSLNFLMPVLESVRSPKTLAHAEELTDFLMDAQRRFLTFLSRELSQGSVSFPQYFLLTYLEKTEMMTMSGIAAKMGHTTAAATGLVDRLERLGYVARSHAIDDRRKVMVRITVKGSNLVGRLRQEMVNCINLILKEYLTPEEGMAWLQIYRKISEICDKNAKKE
jgi:DNA-binding MarR family transcriptional regulator